MDQHLRYWPHIRRVSRQRTQDPALKHEARGNGVGVPSHDALLITETVLSQGGVDRFQVSALWKRHEIVAACIAHQIFDASLLPPSCYIGKERFETIDALEVEKPFMLSSAMSLQHLEDSRFEIVVEIIRGTPPQNSKAWR